MIITDNTLNNILNDNNKDTSSPQGDQYRVVARVGNKLTS